MTRTGLSERVGISLANPSILEIGKARAIRFSTLDAICRALDCQLGDLLGYEPASESLQGKSPCRFNVSCRRSARLFR